MDKTEIESRARKLNNDGVRELLATMVEDTIDEYKSSLRCGLFVGLKANQKNVSHFYCLVLQSKYLWNLVLI